MRHEENFQIRKIILKLNKTRLLHIKSTESFVFNVCHWCKKRRSYEQSQLALSKSKNIKAVKVMFDEVFF